MHAGPASNSFRAVLFFSAVPIADDKGPLTLEYNPDTQFSNVLLAGFVAQLLWRTIGITYSDRLYLLRRLANYIRQADIRTGWDRHFHDHKKLRDVVEKMTSRMNQENLDAYLVTRAKEEDLVFHHIEMVGFRGDFQLVSDARLHTKWDDGISWRVYVFRRARDDRAILQYPDEPVVSIGDGWEGHEPGKHYRLEMSSKDPDVLFNGKNGTLFDDDGKEIKCFLVTKKRKRRGRRRRKSY